MERKKTKSLVTKDLQAAAKAPTTHAPTPARQESHTGPIWAPDGSVLVDRQRFPTLYRCAESGGRVIAAVRAKWAAVEDAARHGHQDHADALRAEILGVAPPRTVVVPADLPTDTQELIEKLKAATDKKTASKIRAELRERGIRGGLRGLRA